MFEFLPAEIREGLERARRNASPRSRRLALHQGDEVFPIRRIWSDGFSIDADETLRLRGFVEIHEGPRPLLICLIQATEFLDGELICTFKRSSPVRDRAAADYELPEDMPRALLPRH